jgi:hypothetical protein
MFDDCTYDDETYADLKERIAAAQGEDHYPMELAASDYRVFAQAWNMGIDSHLEALTERSSVEQVQRGPFTKAKIRIHPEELPVLVRRLFQLGENEDHTGEDGRALSLARGILSSLNIEED